MVGSGGDMTENYSSWIKPVEDILFGQPNNLILLGYLALTGIIVGGWRLFIYYREDRFFPKIEFFCDVLFKSERKNLWIVEIVCVVRNKGVAGHRVKDLNFRLHGLRSDDALVDGDASINEQVIFPHLIKNGRWKARPGMNDRVEAGTSQFYRHVAYVGKEYNELVLHGSMKYRQRKWPFFGHHVTHTCNRLIASPATMEEARQELTGERMRLEFGDIAQAN